MSSAQINKDETNQLKSDRRKVLKQLPQIKDLTFGPRIGRGHFSHVYKGTYKGSTDVAIKLIERGDDDLIASEISLLKELNNAPNIVQLYCVKKCELTILIFEYSQSITKEYYFQEITYCRLRTILHSLLEAVDYAHSKGIAHCDIKFGNIMISQDFNSLRLIDWGCGQHVSSEMDPKAGSRLCRSPEMLLGYQNYGTGGDIWAIGIFILFTLTHDEIPWRQSTCEDTIYFLSKYFPVSEIQKIINRYNLPQPEKLSTHKTRTIEKLFSILEAKLQQPKLIDFMKYLLTVDPEKRPTARQALQHPYFHE